ncbi:SH3 domain-containing kinase-binding protein 1-like [Phyllobates terribilis]|uniref:SH3 domain-containing kinase-binding protein 1-like n=1 Tax=Phyllobates terribilis TaxID=111132 RepID=UPI003CCB2374
MNFSSLQGQNTFGAKRSKICLKRDKHNSRSPTKDALVTFLALTHVNIGGLHVVLKCSSSKLRMKETPAVLLQSDVEGFDSLVSTGEKLSPPTASRPKSSGRRPPSQSLTSSSLSSPDFFDSPSPEDDKDDINHLSQRPIDSSKKAPRSLTSQVPENRAALPPKPGGLISSVSFSHGAPGAPSAFHIVTSSSHRSNSPSFGSSDARHTVEHGQSSLEELQAQVKELRSIIETMKDQQKKEIKQLLSELDEEKKIRLRLQMDVNEIKKSLQSK